MNVPGKVSYLFIAALLLAEMTSAIELTMIFTALPTLSREFGNSPMLGWVATASLLTSAIASALCGRLGDLHGRRLILLIVLCFAVIGSLISGFSTSLGGVIIGTSFQGVAGALLPLCVALVRERCSPEQTPFIVGLVLGSAGFAAGLGLIAGGYLTDSFGWQSIFFFSAASAVVSIIGVLLFIAPNAPRPMISRGKINYFAGVLYAPGIACLLLVITKGSSWGWSDPRTLLFSLLSVLILTYWVRHQLREETPLINLRLLANHRVSIVFLSIILFALGPAQHTLLMSRFLQQPTFTLVGMGMTAALAGLTMMPVRIFGITAAPIGGMLCSKIGPRLVLIAGAAVVFVGWAIITIGLHDLKLVFAGMILEGWGFQLIYVGFPNALIKAVSEDITGEVTGLSQVVKMIALACGAQIIMVLLSNSGASGPGVESFPSLLNYRIVFVYILIATALSGLAAAALPRDKIIAKGSV